MTVTATRGCAEPTTGPYARVPHCRQHTDYQAGCTTCRRYRAWTVRRRRRAVETGQPLCHDIGDVRTHLRALQQAGLLLVDISRAAGISRNTIAAILYDTTRRVVYRHNAAAILAVPVPARTHRPPTSNLIPAVGTLRRIRALHRLGWTQRHILAAAGSLFRLDQVTRQEWVTERFAAAVRTAYEALSMRTGPSAITARRAAAAGWPGPLGWDDDTIDDPAAQPDLGGADDTDLIDEVAVERALAGGRVTLTDAERRHAMAVGLDRGMTRTAVGLALHISGWEAKRLAGQVAPHTQAA